MNANIVFAGAALTAAAIGAGLGLGGLTHPALAEDGLMSLAAPSAGRPSAAPAGATGAAAEARAEEVAQLERDFQRFALNALLLPLLDHEHHPQRWQDPLLATGCGSGSAVLVDGRPLVPGAEVPTGAFKLQWMLDDCRPFGPSSLTLAGGVDLVVFRDDERGLNAHVQPRGLRVAKGQAVRRWQREFVASLR